MPSGIQLSLTKLPPRCFSFVLTDAVGKRLFGCSLVFYQRIPEGVLAKSLISGVKEDSVYSTRSICLLSHYPFYKAQREWLCYVFETFLNGQEKNNINHQIQSNNETKNEKNNIGQTNNNVGTSTTSVRNPNNNGAVLSAASKLQNTPTTNVTPNFKQPLPITQTQTQQQTIQFTSFEEELIHLVMNIPLAPEYQPMNLKIDQRKSEMLTILRSRPNNIPIVDVKKKDIKKNNERKRKK